MISARIRYAALYALAVGVFITALARLLVHDKLGAVLGLVVTAVCLYGCRRIRLTADRRQEEQILELKALDTRVSPDWPDGCCELAFISRGDFHHLRCCTRAQQR
ncbi:hypothetical protein [Streptomyces cyaneofuscatus]|uniref:hypothetical protein n=1 Tax=Streptomyces cyaneofuscatus TaxID=66883 RepID=UPI00339E9F69